MRSSFGQAHSARSSTRNEGDLREPIHGHVRRGGDEAKVWLDPEIAITESHGSNARALNDILPFVAERQEEIERAWHDHFGD